jgi:O-antigen ligase
MVIAHSPRVARAAAGEPGPAGAGTVATAALAFVALEPFESYVKSVTSSGVKLLGALVVAAWLLRVLARHRPMRLDHPSTRAAAVFFAVLLASTVAHDNGSLGAEVMLRYLSYLGIFVVLVDCMRDRLAPRLVASVYVASCAIAAIAGLMAYVLGQLRAGGPVGDPNDFAFFLVAAVPLALGLRPAARRPLLFSAAAVVMSVALLATLSRGAIVGVAAMLASAVVAGIVRVRTLFGWLAAAALVVGVAALALHPKITISVAAKSQVAQQNVDERLVRWRAAAQMTADHPLLGLGPAGFRESYDRYIDYQPTSVSHPLDVAHEMYLETSAELGLLGAGALIGLMVFGFAGARRAARAGPRRERDLGAAVSVAAVGTAVAAVFLTEQYFLPIWLLAAFGAALDPAWRGR